MIVDLKINTPLNFEELEEFLKSFDTCSSTLRTRILNALRRRGFTTEQSLIQLDLHNDYRRRLIYGLSNITVLSYIEPYQKILIKKQAEYDRKIKNETIKNELNGDLEVFKNQEPFKVLLDVYHSKFKTDILGKLPEYKYQDANVQRNILDILDKYRDLMLETIDDLSKL